MKEYDIPRYIDSQQQFLFWELDEFCVCSGLFMIGILSDTLTVMCIVIYFVTNGMARMKNNTLDGLLFHLCFWLGLVSVSNEFDDAVTKEMYQ